MTLVKRKKPSDSNLSPTLKEAVTQGVVGRIYERVSGRGPDGEVLFGNKPRQALHAGFLLPVTQEFMAPEAPNMDEAIDRQVIIRTHGMDFQARDDRHWSLTIYPKARVYLRVLPTRQDLLRPGMSLSPRIRREISRAIHQKIQEYKQEGKITDDTGKESIYVRACRELNYPQAFIDRTQGSMAKAFFDELDEQEPDEDGDNGNRDASSQEAQVYPIPRGEVQDINDFFEPVSISHRWERVDLDIEPLVIHWNSETSWLDQVDVHEQLMNEKIREQLEEWAYCPGNHGRIFRRGLTARVEDIDQWDRFLERVAQSELPPAIPELSLHWEIRRNPDLRDKDVVNLRVALENRSREPERYRQEVEPCFFDVGIELSIPEAMHRSMVMDRIKPSYQVNRFLEYPAMGLNGAVLRREPSDDGQLMFETTWMPRFHQPRLVPVEHDYVNRKIADLAKPGGHKGLESLIDAYTDWIDRQEPKIQQQIEETGAEKELSNFFKDREHGWKPERSAIQAGLQILEDSYVAWNRNGKSGRQNDPGAAPYEAWLSMNEAMYQMMRTRIGSEKVEWRLFQIGFILAALPALVTRIPQFHDYFDPNRDEAVTLLYFATGGGKSEAFFGLLTFNLFLDRLRGKTFGVTAMVRYPLRLLTIQQAGRAALTLAYAERVRRQRRYPGEPFSIGFWVGSGGSPNRRSEASGLPSLQRYLPGEELGNQQANVYEELEEDWRKLTNCPFCGGNVCLRKASQGVVAHVCENHDCESHALDMGGCRGYQPLPFFMCDEDIYAKAPSVLLGTVDKLALIGQSDSTVKKVLGMFGAAGWRDRHGHLVPLNNDGVHRARQTPEDFTPLYPAHKDGERIFHDPFPSLLVQDEAHLLEQSLGSFSSLFETLFEATMDQLGQNFPEQSIARFPHEDRRRRAKVIAASATVSDPERHMQHLYQREIPMRRFPHPGPDIYHSFYAEPKAREGAQQSLTPDMEEHSAHWARLYCAIVTNGKPHTSSMVGILAAFHRIITEAYETLREHPEQVELVREDLRRAMDQRQPNAPALLQAIDQADAGDLLTLVDLHRIALTYVTNKKGGDQILAAEPEETRYDHEKAGLEYKGARPDLITSDVDQGEIQRIIEAAAQRPYPGEFFDSLEDQLRSVVATSAVSHGVDVEEFNSMFFAGMPADIAEYIQASSRVGRIHSGFCMLVPIPHQRRDRYIAEVFDSFHRFLERMVQPAAIDRYAENAIRRALPSVLVNYLGGVLPIKRYLVADESSRAYWSDHRRIEDFIDLFRSRDVSDSMAQREALRRYVLQALGITDHQASPDTRAFYEQLLGDLLESVIAQMYSENGASLSIFMNEQSLHTAKPMSSLRDVDDPAWIRVRGRDQRGNLDGRITDRETEATKQLMKVARFGHL